MTTPSRSTNVKPDVKKEENSNQQWAVQIATSVVEAIDEKKEDSGKGPVPEPYEGDHKDTCQFLFDLELYFKMNPSRSNTDKKKKMILLLLLKGKTTEWKMTEQEQLFPEDDDPEDKKKAAEETWSVFKNKFRKHWQPVDVAGDAQMRIRDLQMKERADDYINQFCLLASQTGYDDVALMTFFKEGLVPSLQDKIMLRSEGPPDTLDKCDKKDYMIQGKCFQCAQIGHISQDCPLKGQIQTERILPLKAEPKMTPQDVFTKVQKMILEQGAAEQEEIFDLMGKEVSTVVLAKFTRHSMHIPFTYNNGTEIIEGKALIDSGAGGRFISEEEAQKTKKPWNKLVKPIKVYNVDGTRNKIGWITHMITMDISIGDREMTETLFISGLGPERMILGLPWLQDHNPDIDWIMGVIRFRPRRKIMVRRPIKHFSGILDRAEDEEVIIWSFIRGEEDSDEIRINAKLSTSQVLAQAHEVKSKSLEELIPPYLLDYTDRFEKKKSERFPPSRPYDHAIDLKPNFKPQDYENLRKGYIRPSKSLMASPFFFVSKKEAGALRPCQDYRDLNNRTIKNRYPLPLVTNLVDKLKMACVFTKLDLQNRYNNIQIKDGDQWKVAFKTPRGLFEPTVMFFGLTNSPATFQAFMNDILKDFIDKGWCVVYMDDILIFSDDRQTHQLRTRQVLERLREHDLYLKLEKCEFDVVKTLFLGLVITPGHVQMDPTKLVGIKDWEPPTTVKGVRSFLGFANFYRKFIGRYAEIA
uniref:Putative reverse transcriptase-rnase h-integrase n=1 Tax=Moniliophthora roreri TaxID=221103 RepID=A0A0W0GC45_MONRR